MNREHFAESRRVLRADLRPDARPLLALLAWPLPAGQVGLGAGPALGALGPAGVAVFAWCIGLPPRQLALAYIARMIEIDVPRGRPSPFYRGGRRGARAFRVAL